MGTPRGSRPIFSATIASSAATTVASAATTAAVQAHLIFVMDLELLLVGDAPAIDADKAFAGDWIVHDVGVKIFLATCGFLTDISIVLFRALTK